ncbi:hypothetical protein J6590_095900 [Homalodisca vitripennis]|nr:hypothetical protein J6590_095900 [Homalodisca vitripennis]
MPGRAQLTDQQNNPHGGERSERVAAQPCRVSADRKCRPSVTDSDNRISTGTSLRLHTDHYRRLPLQELMVCRVLTEADVEGRELLKWTEREKERDARLAKWPRNRLYVLVQS